MAPRNTSRRFIRHQIWILPFLVASEDDGHPDLLLGPIFEHGNYKDRGRDQGFSHCNSPLSRCLVRHFEAVIPRTWTGLCVVGV